MIPRPPSKHLTCCPRGNAHAELSGFLYGCPQGPSTSLAAPPPRKLLIPPANHTFHQLALRFRATTLVFEGGQVSAPSEPCAQALACRSRVLELRCRREPRRGFFNPVASLFLTSRFTSAAKRSSCCLRKSETARRSRTESARRAHDSALTIMSSRSSTRNSQTESVRFASPCPPCERTFSGIVLTSAARRHQRSGDRAHR